MGSIAKTSFAVNRSYKVFTPAEWEQLRRALRLSGRQLQIVQYVFDDAKTECIATELGISVHTVNTYIQRLYSKLNVHSRSQLLLHVLRTRLCCSVDNGKLNASNYDRNIPQSDVVSISDGRLRDL